MITGPFEEGLAQGAENRQRQAHRPSTNAARTSAVRLYLAFCSKINVDYTVIRYYHICWYIEYLTRHLKSPASISNAVSHLRTFYTLSGLSTTALYHHRVGMALKAVAVNIRHAPSKRAPVTPAVLRRALANINELTHPHLTRLAILLMYMGFLRQSSAAPPTVAAFDPTRHLTVGDASITPQGLVLKVKWTKTLQSAADATAVTLPATKDAALCPVRAFNKYQQSLPPPAAPTAPLLRYKDGNPATVPFIRKQWAALLDKVGLSAKIYTLHSLRKGAAQYTYNTGKADLNDVMHHGTWRSQAVRIYIKPDVAEHNSVHRALRRI